MSWQKSKNLVLARTKLRMHLKYVTGQPLKYSPEQQYLHLHGGKIKTTHKRERKNTMLQHLQLIEPKKVLQI